MQTIINDKYIPVLKSLNYNINDVLEEFLLLKVNNKISEYRSKKEFYRNKYKSNFKEFEKQINNRLESEKNDEYNDYLAWKFAIESLNYFQNQIQTI